MSSSSSCLLVLFLIKILYLKINNAVNHWELTPEGTIQPQVDSIFYLRRPDDLMAFLNQFEHRQLITAINSQLLALQLEITDKVQQSTMFQVEIMYHTECLIYYSIKEDDMYSTLKDRKYFNRINTKRMITKSNEHKRMNDLYPICDPVSFSMSCFEHLGSMINRKKLTMAPEVPLLSDDLGIMKESFVKMISLGLKQEPLSWKYAVLGSYYWRAKGNARRAVDCARRAIYLAPRKYLDIPLLSLGTILQRANRSQDAVVAMHAAAEHASDVFENQVGLGNALFLTSDFHGALKAFENAAAIDQQFVKRLEFVRKSITCFKNIKLKLNEIERQVAEVFALLDNYKANQTQLEQHLNKVLQEQVPIGKRLADPSFDIYSHHLLHRGQYCKTKMMPNSKEPILFCDFYSDLQMQSEKEDLIVDIVQHYAEAAPKFIENFSLGVYRHLNIENYDENSNTVFMKNGEDLSTAPDTISSSETITDSKLKQTLS